MAHDHTHHGDGEAVDEEEIVRTLAHELEDSFIAYLHDEIGFDDLTFEVFDTLQAVHAVQTGSYSVEYLDDEESPTEMQEELAQEPARTGSQSRKGGSRRK